MSVKYNDKQILHIGFDDTDSIKGKCTTYLGFKIVKHIKKTGRYEFVDYPSLIRLNPNVPWKTRGNGAVCIRITGNRYDELIEYIISEVEQESYIGSGANPGVVFFRGNEIPDDIVKFSSLAMHDFLSRQHAKKLTLKNNIKDFSFGNGNGIIGALAAIGNNLNTDHTFEAIAYRKIERCGTPRFIDKEKIVKMNIDTFPQTFNNYDEKHQRILITPHGPDPVFCGIRGESPEIVLKSLKKLDIKEDVDGYMIYRTNQGTNMHLFNELNLSSLKTYTSGFLICKLATKPRVINGGHVLFFVEDKYGSALAAVYEPTGLGKIASELDVGDLIQIGIGVRKSSNQFPKTLNIEYLNVLNLVQKYDIVNPKCKVCDKRLKSEGKNKGFQCDKCGHKEKEVYKLCIPNERQIKIGLYLPSPKSHRHLTKPIHRYGAEKKEHEKHEQLFENWFGTSL